VGLEVFKKSQLATRAQAIVEDRWDRRQCDGGFHVDQIGGTLGDSAQAVSGSVKLGSREALSSGFVALRTLMLRDKAIR